MYSKFLDAYICRLDPGLVKPVVMVCMFSSEDQGRRPISNDLNISAHI